MITGTTSTPNSLATVTGHILFHKNTVREKPREKGNWAQSTFAKASGNVTRDREKELAKELTGKFLSSDPTNTCGTHFGSSSLLVVSQVAQAVACFT